MAEEGAEGPTATPPALDPIEAALAGALTHAATAGRFDVVAQLAKELEARRLGRSDNVVTLDTSGAAVERARGVGRRLRAILDGNRQRDR